MDGACNKNEKGQNKDRYQTAKSGKEREEECQRIDGRMKMKKINRLYSLYLPSGFIYYISAKDSSLSSFEYFSFNSILLSPLN